MSEQTAVSSSNFHVVTPHHQQMEAQSSTADCLCRLSQLLCSLLAERLSREVEATKKENQSSIISEDAIRDLPGR